jgi:WD40 repeat protein/serine/threonine protein kinase
MKTNDQNAQEIFGQAVDMADGTARRAYLDQACGGDAALREEVESLLAANSAAGEFLHQPAPIAAGAAQKTMFIPPLSEKTGTRIGRYKLLEQIGEGGFGVVWMAEQEEPVRRRVALKLIKLGMDTREVVARFEAERQALAMMDHPHIASVFDGGATETGRPYFVMELVKGVPLTDYCDANQLSTAQRLELFMQVCHAVQHAHQKGVIHRDLKPSNILVTVQDDQPVPKVIDFGVAKATQARLTEKTVFTQFRQWIGTPAYMSPEQAGLGSLDVDTRSDIYSLGVLLYELLTGRTPFDTSKLMERGYDAVMQTIREEDPPKPSTRLSTLNREELTAVAAKRSAEPGKLSRLVHGDLDWIVMKALEKGRQRRYETANSFAEDLARHLMNVPVTARPPTLGYRIRKTVRRHRLVTAFTAAIVLSLAMGIVVSTRQTLRSWRFAREAEHQRQIAASEAVNALKAGMAAKQAQQRAESSEAEVRHSLYVAHIRAIEDASKNQPRMRELLDGARTYTNRDFEWGFWQQRTERAEMHGNADIIESVRFTPKGDRVIGFGMVHSAYVWDWPSGKQVVHLREITGSDVLPLPVALSPDGNRIATGSANHTARVCDALSGTTLLVLAGHGGFVTSLTFSPDGKWIATGDEANTARIWDASTGIQRFTLGSPTNRLKETLHRGSSTELSPPVGPQGLRIIGLGTTARSVRVVGIGDLFAPSNPSKYYVMVAFSADSRLLATFSSDGSASLWNADSGDLLSTLETGMAGNPTELVFLQNGRQLLTARSSGPPSLWELPSGTLAFHLGSLRDPLTRVAVSPDGRFVVTSAGQESTLWDASKGTVLRTFREPLERIAALGISPDGQRVVTAGRTVRLWDAASGSELACFSGNVGPVRAMAFSADGKWLLTGDSHVVRIWRCPDKPFRLSWNIKAPFTAAAMSPTEDRIAIAQGTTIGVWDTASGQFLHSLSGHSQPVTAVTFSPDGHLIASGAQDGSVKFWETSSRGQAGPSISHQEVRAVAFSRDGSKLLTTSGTARAWDVQTRRRSMEIQRRVENIPAQIDVPTIILDETAKTPADHGKTMTISGGRSVGYVNPPPIWAFLTTNDIIALPKAGNSAVYSPDGRRILIAGEARSTTAVLREADTGREFLRLEGHTKEVLSAAFSSDGRRILTGSLDGTARIWDAATGDQLLTLMGYESGVSFVAFSFDGSKAVLGTRDGVFTILDSSVPKD